MKTVIVALTLAVFVALEVDANYLLEDRDEQIEMLQELGFEKDYIDKLNETMTRQGKLYCDAGMKDEAKVKKYQDCDYQFLGKITSKYYAKIIEACTEEATKGISSLEVRQLECGDISSQYDAILETVDHCVDTKGISKTKSLLQTLKTDRHAVSKLKPIFDSMIRCYDAALA